MLATSGRSLMVVVLDEELLMELALWGWVVFVLCSGQRDQTTTEKRGRPLIRLASGRPSFSRTSRV